MISNSYLKLWTEAVEERLSRPVAVFADFERVGGKRSKNLRIHNNRLFYQINKSVRWLKLQDMNVLQ